MISNPGTRLSKWSVSCTCHFTSGRTATGTHCIEGWLGPKAGMYSVENCKQTYFGNQKKGESDSSGAFPWFLHVVLWCSF